MRIVRFQFEPWQKEGSEASHNLATDYPCALENVVILSPFMRHRQRSPDLSDKYVKRFHSTFQSNERQKQKEKSMRRARHTNTEFVRTHCLQLWSLTVTLHCSRCSLKHSR